MNIEIIPFTAEHSAKFRELNIAWLEQFFWVEPHDEEVLGNPEKYIISPGGNIFFVKEGDEIIGTVALMKIDEGVFELTKMAITPSAQGKKFGQKLMEHTLNYARNKGWKTLIIYSSRKLVNALHIYRKNGFVEIPIEENNPYARGDIKMKLELS